MKRRAHSGRGLGGELPSYGFDLELRPDSYWDSPASIYANIKGTWRRRQIAEWREGDPAGPVPSLLFADSMEEPLRTFMGSIHPSMLGGEYLPDYKNGEIEIARVELASVLADVISVRARRRTDGAIGYRVVHEHPQIGTYVLRRKRRTSLPLTLREMIELIETAELIDDDGEIVEMDGCVDPRGLVRPFWAAGSVEEVSLKQAVACCRVSSYFYRELNDWYAVAAEAWIDDLSIEAESAEWRESLLDSGKVVFNTRGWRCSSTA